MEKLRANKTNLDKIAIAAGNDLDAIAQEIALNISELWRIGQAYVVTRIETYDGYKELVVVCMQGEDAKKASAQLVNIAKHSGMASIRFHTQHKGLERLLKSFAPVEVERVYKVALDGQ